MFIAVWDSTTRNPKQAEPTRPDRTTVRRSSRPMFVCPEYATDENLGKIQEKYGLMAEKTKEDLKKGKLDTHTHDIDLSPVIKTNKG